jgi:acetylornithine deacetylase/succinyl-diaminopimelate desuccinylase-like protein
MQTNSDLVSRVRAAVKRDRLLDSAVRLCEVQSWTGQGGAVADRLAGILKADGFVVERPTAGHAVSPAVVTRFESGRPGRCIQFNGHLDTVHLPFVAPRVVGSRLTGSGSCDMKGGIAAMIEALRAVRDSGVLMAGSILATAHDLHEAPWGYGTQLDRLIRDGVHGDAVLIPEPLCDCVPTVGRGSATWKIHVRRSGPPIHEVMRPVNEPNVIAAGADLVARFMKLNDELSRKSDPQAGQESLFIGQIHSGEIFNQYPQECWLEGTRRWLPETDPASVETGFRELVNRFAADWHAEARIEYNLIRNAFRLDLAHPMVTTFRESYATASGKEIPFGPKPFVDDGNSFWRLANVPAITHGARAGGQHTVEEWVEIDDLVRVAVVYAVTAANYCSA